MKLKPNMLHRKFAIMTNFMLFSNSFISAIKRS